MHSLEELQRREALRIYRRENGKNSLKSRGAFEKVKLPCSNPKCDRLCTDPTLNINKNAFGPICSTKCRNDMEALERAKGKK